MRFFHKFREVYGLNRRNRDLVMRANPPAAIAIANDKVATNYALRQAAIPVPEEYAVLRSPAAAPHIFPELCEKPRGFVAKPSQGACGQGVHIFTGPAQHFLTRQNGTPVSLRDFRFLVAAIISGEFSHGKPIDAVLLEERLQPSTSWILPDLPGAPDLRIIVFQGRPVLAMARIPTAASDGKANLHRGGVGLGIDMLTGTTTFALWKNRSIEKHPDTGAPLAGLSVAEFQSCVALAARCAQVTPLGYMGVDIIYDENRGPCVLEINARPGLAIQVANRMGLGRVLDGAEAAGQHEREEACTQKQKAVAPAE